MGRDKRTKSPSDYNKTEKNKVKLTPAELHQERLRQKAILKEQLFKAREAELSTYTIIYSDEERPEPEHIIEEIEKEPEIKKLSLNEIIRKAKITATGYDSAYITYHELIGQIAELDSMIATRAPKGSSDEVKAEFAEKRKAYKKEKKSLETKSLVAYEKAIALERSADEYAYIISLLTTEKEENFRSQPRLNEKRIDLTREEELELVERYLYGGKKKSAVEKEFREAIREIKTLKVLGHEQKEPETTAETIVESEKEETAHEFSMPRKSFFWIIAAVAAVVILILTLTQVGLKEYKKTSIVKKKAAETVTPQEIVVEEPVIEDPEKIIVEVIESFADPEPVIVEPDVPYIDNFEVHGIPVTSYVSADQCVITYPRSVFTEAQVMDYASKVTAEYRKFLGYSEIDYNPEGSLTVIHNIGLSDEDKVVVSDVIRDSLSGYADSILAAERAAEEARIKAAEAEALALAEEAAREALIDRNIYGEILYRGYGAELIIGPRSSEISFPMLSEEDAMLFIARISSKYASMLDGFTYKLGDHKITIDYPVVLDEEDQLYIFDILNSETVALIDELVPIETIAEPEVVPAASVEPVVKMVPDPEKSIYGEILYEGYGAELIIGQDKMVIAIDGVSQENLEMFAEFIAKNNPEFLKDAVYSISEGKVIVDYPDIFNEDEQLYIFDVLNREAIAFIDSILYPERVREAAFRKALSAVDVPEINVTLFTTPVAEDPVVVEPSIPEIKATLFTAPVEEVYEEPEVVPAATVDPAVINVSDSEKIIRGEILYEGYGAELIIGQDKMEVAIAGVSKENLELFVEFLTENNPEFLKDAVYSVSGGKVVVDYQDILSEDEQHYIYDVLNREAIAFIDSILYPERVGEAAFRKALSTVDIPEINVTLFTSPVVEESVVIESSIPEIRTTHSTASVEEAPGETAPIVEQDKITPTSKRVDIPEINVSLEVAPLTEAVDTSEEAPLMKIFVDKPIHFERDFSYKGVDASFDISNSYSRIAIGLTDEEIGAFISEASKEYSGYLEGVSFDVDNGVIVARYPVSLTEEDMELVYRVISGKLQEYIDYLLSVPPVEEEPEPVIPLDMNIYGELLYKGFGADIIIGQNSTEITLKGVEPVDAEAFIEAVAPKYRTYLDGVTYHSAGDTYYVDYPYTLGEEEQLDIYDMLNRALVSYVEEILSMPRIPSIPSIDSVESVLVEYPELPAFESVDTRLVYPIPSVPDVSDVKQTLVTPIPEAQVIEELSQSLSSGS